MFSLFWEGEGPSLMCARSSLKYEWHWKERKSSLANLEYKLFFRQHLLMHVRIWLQCATKLRTYFLIHFSIVCGLFVIWFWKPSKLVKLRVNTHSRGKQKIYWHLKLLLARPSCFQKIKIQTFSWKKSNFFEDWAPKTYFFG